MSWSVSFRPAALARCLTIYGCCILLVHFARASSSYSTLVGLSVGSLPWATSAVGSRQPTLASPHPIAARLGTHVLLEVRGAPFVRLNSSATVLAAMHSAVKAGGLTVVNEFVHEFPVQGCSAVLMISESHLSIHTWPEHGYAAVDLFTCGGASSLPCSPHEAVRYEPHDGWRCAGGELAGRGVPGSLWAAVQALLDGLEAGGAMLTWLERGLPAPAVAHLGDPPAPSLGWLAGLENEQGQRPEL